MTRSVLGMAVHCSALGLLASQAFASEHAQLDRTVLPIPAPQRQTYTEIDARNAAMPPRFEIRAPGKATLKFDLAYDGGGLGKGGLGMLYVNGEKVAEAESKFNGHVPRLTVEFRTAAAP